MFKELSEINKKPEPFEFYTAEDLWTDEHTSRKMLEYHLNESVDLSSRNIKFINRSISWITGYFNLNDQSKVLDCGCGPGLYTIRLAEHGSNVTGIDFSKKSIEYAKEAASKKNLEINYIHDNYLEFKTDEKFDLIIMIMCDFCALSPEQRRVMLGKFKEFLAPGGQVLLDVYSYNSYDLKNECASYEFNHMDNFWSADDYFCFINTYKYDEEKVTLDKYTIIERENIRTVYNWLQYFSENTIKKEFSDSGLEIYEMFADVCGDNYDAESLEFAVLARLR